MSICPNLPGISANGCANSIYRGAGGELAGLWDDLGGASPTSLANLGQLLFNQFRATGPNYTWGSAISQGALSKPVMDALVRKYGLPHAPGDLRNARFISCARRRIRPRSAPLGFIGNLGRNVHKTSSFSSIDFRLTRKISLTPRVSLNISMDVFDLFNRANIKAADTAFTKSGNPVSAFNPRQLQFALRIDF